MLKMRNANISDHEFLVRIDLKNDGYTVSEEVDMTEQEKEEHSKKIGRFLNDADKGVFIIAMGMLRYSATNGVRRVRSKSKTFWQCSWRCDMLSDFERKLLRILYNLHHQSWARPDISRFCRLLGRRESEVRAAIKTLQGAGYIEVRLGELRVLEGWERQERQATSQAHWRMIFR